MNDIIEIYTEPTPRVLRPDRAAVRGYKSAHWVHANHLVMPDIDGLAIQGTFSNTLDSVAMLKDLHINAVSSLGLWASRWISQPQKLYLLLYPRPEKIKTLFPDRLGLTTEIIDTHRNDFIRWLKEPEFKNAIIIANPQHELINDSFKKLSSAMSLLSRARTVNWEKFVREVSQCSWCMMLQASAIEKQSAIIFSPSNISQQLYQTIYDSGDIPQEVSWKKLISNSEHFLDTTNSLNNSPSLISDDMVLFNVRSLDKNIKSWSMLNVNIEDFGFLNDFHDLQALRFNKIPFAGTDELKEAPNLHALWISDHPQIPENTLQSLPELQYLAFDHPELFDEQKDQLDKLSLHGLLLYSNSSYRWLKDIDFITKLNLSRFEAYWHDLIDLSALRALPIKDLSLAHGSITNITVLSDLSCLQTSNLSDNPISDLTPLQYLPLEDLDLSFTQVKDIKPLRNLSNLRKLSLEATELEDIESLLELPQLEALNLSHTNIKQIDILRYLPCLKEIRLSHSKIQDFSVLKHLDELEKIHLTNISLSNLPKLNSPKKINTLNLSGSQITDCRSLIDCINLKILDLSNTKINDISTLERMQQLEVLSLEATLVRDISVLQYLPKLKVLNLSQTPVNELPSQLPKTLLELDISKTDIRDISALKGLSQLETLSLSHTDISDISMLRNCRELSTLYLCNNAYKSSIRKPLSIAVLKELPKLRIVDTSGHWITDDLEIRRPNLLIAVEDPPFSYRIPFHRLDLDKYYMRWNKTSPWPVQWLWFS